MNDLIIHTLSNYRLTLREYTQEDIFPYFELMSNANAIKHYRIPLKRIEEVEKEFESDKRRILNQEMKRWVITLTPQNKFIGTIDVYEINKYKRLGTLGCALVPDYQHQGIGYESISLVLKHMFEQENINRIQLYVNPENIQAIKTYLKIGFRQEGLLREFEYDGYEYKDMLIFSLLKREFLSL